jgi:hypothetical protein
MTLSELFGDNPNTMSDQEREFFEQAKVLWAKQFEQIIRESRGPKPKTRIIVKKAKNNG